MIFLKRLIFLSIFLLASCSQEPSFYDTEGARVQLSQLKGQWIIVNYWASWCAACLKEIPELNQFYADHKNVKLYGVNFDQLSEGELKRTIKKMHITFPVLIENPNKAWQLGEVTVLPTTFIINPAGKIIKKIGKFSSTEVIDQ